MLQAELNVYIDKREVHRLARGSTAYTLDAATDQEEGDRSNAGKAVRGF